MGGLGRGEEVKGIGFRLQGVKVRVPPFSLSLPFPIAIKIHLQQTPSHPKSHHPILPWRKTGSVREVAAMVGLASLARTLKGDRAGGPDRRAWGGRRRKVNRWNRFRWRTGNCRWADGGGAARPTSGCRPIRQIKVGSGF